MVLSRDSGGWRRSAVPALSALLIALLTGCANSDDSDGAGSASHRELKRAEVLQVPADFSGPIDPNWPPTHPARREAELEAARLYRERKKLGNLPPRGEPLVVGDVPNLFVEEGRIGDFDYLEVIVGDMRDPDAAMPLVVILHGRGGSPNIPAGPFPTGKPIRIFLPRAPDRLGAGYTWLASRTLDNKEQLFGRSLAGRVDQLAPAIEAFSRLRKTRGRILVAGFSQGAILTYGLVLRYPKLFAAGFPIAGWCPEELIPSRAPKNAPLIFARHGASDEVVPLALERETVKLLRKRGHQVHLIEEPGAGHIVTRAMNQGVRGDIFRFLGINSSDLR